MAQVPTRVGRVKRCRYDPMIHDDAPEKGSLYVRSEKYWVLSRDQFTTKISTLIWVRAIGKRGDKTRAAAPPFWPSGAPIQKGPFVH